MNINSMRIQQAKTLVINTFQWLIYWIF